MTTVLTEQGVATSLLPYLRNVLRNPVLTYTESPTRISGGYDTHIHYFRLGGAPAAFAGPLVLRVFRADTGATPARFESAVLHAAASLGFPVPRILLVEPDAAH